MSDINWDDDDEDNARLSSAKDPEALRSAIRRICSDFDWRFLQWHDGPELRDTYDGNPIMMLLQDYEQLMGIFARDDHLWQTVQAAVTAIGVAGSTRKKSKPGPKKKVSQGDLRAAIETYLEENDGSFPTQEELAHGLLSCSKTIKVRAKEFYGGWNEMKTFFLTRYRQQHG